MGFLARLDDWLSARQPDKSDGPPMVIQYGSTKSYTFRREVLRDNFKLPELPDQGSLIAVLRAVQQFCLPDITDEDYDNLQQMLILMDDVILAGLKDPHNWVLPQGFSDIPFVRQRLEKNFPIEQILDYMLEAIRLYAWWYRHDESVSELIPHLLELEESFASLRTRVQGAEDSRGPLHHVDTLRG